MAYARSFNAKNWRNQAGRDRQDFAASKMPPDTILGTIDKIEEGMQNQGAKVRKNILRITQILARTGGTFQSGKLKLVCTSSQNALFFTGYIN